MFQSSGWCCELCVGSVLPSVHCLVILARASLYAQNMHKMFIDPNTGASNLKVDQTLMAAIIDCFFETISPLKPMLTKETLNEHLKQSDRIRKIALIMRIIANFTCISLDFGVLLLNSGIINFTQVFLGIIITLILEQLVKLDLKEYLPNPWFDLMIVHCFRVITSYSQWFCIESISKRSAFSSRNMMYLYKLYKPFITKAHILALSPLLTCIKEMGHISDNHQIDHHDETTNKFALFSGLVHPRSCEMSEFTQAEKGRQDKGEHFLEKEQGLFKKEQKEADRNLNLINSCAYCRTKNEPSLKLCSRCKKVLYCNKDCQKKHFSTHKVDCKN